MRQLFSEPHIPSAPKFIMETFRPQDLQLLFYFPSLCRNCFLLCSGGFLPPQGPEEPHPPSLDHDQGRKQQPKPSQHHRAMRCWTRNHQHPPEPSPSGASLAGENTFLIELYLQIKPLHKSPKATPWGGRESITCQEVFGHSKAQIPNSELTATWLLLGMEQNHRGETETPRRDDAPLTPHSLSLRSGSTVL